MIYTGSYKNCLKGHLVSISGDRGKCVNFLGACFSALAPKLSFWKIWHDNIGKVPDEINNNYYIEEYYEQVLKQLDPNEIIRYFIDGTTLLCYEDNLEFCHRHIVAYWLEKTLGINVPEVKVDKTGNITILDRPIWIGEFLDEVMHRQIAKKDLQENAAKQLVKKPNYYDPNLEFFRKCIERK